MNKLTFDMMMRAVDDSILEEAQQPMNVKVLQIRVLRAIAAVFICAILAGTAILRPWEKISESDSVDDSAAEILQLGYSVAVPEDAENVSYSIVSYSDADTENDEDVPMAQAVFTENGVQYTCRALKTEYPENISGSDEAENSMEWRAGDLDMQLVQSEYSSYVGWYSAETGTQWCLSTDEEDDELLDTARSIIELLGFSVIETPDGAENIGYSVFKIDELVVGETTFTLDGVNYAYRTASTGEIDENFADISGTNIDYEYSARAELSWCSARIYYNEGGAGKLVWFDVVPGLLYSLTVDSGASEQTIMDMALELWTPAQGDS